MATVPQVTVPQVQTRPLQPVYQSAGGTTLENFGYKPGLETAAKGLQQFGNKVDDYAMQNLKDDISRQAKDLDTQFSEKLRQITYGDDQTPGYYNTEGQGAVDAYKPTQAAIQKARDDISKNITNSYVKQAFDLSSGARAESEFESMSRFVGVQRNQAMTDTSNARIANARDDAAARWNDQGAIDDNLLITGAEISDQAKRHNWSEEVTAQKQADARSSLMTSVITSAVVQDPLGAEKMYQENKDKIQGTDQAKLEAMLKQQTLAYKARDAAAGIIASTSDFSAQLAQAKKISDPNLQEAVMSQIHRNYAQAEYAKNQYEKTVRDEAFRVANTGGDVDAWLQQNPGKALTLQENNLIYSVQDAAYNYKIGQEFARKSDGTTFNTVSSMDVKTLSQLDPDTLKHNLTLNEYKQVVNKIQGATARINAAQGDSHLYSVAESEMKKFAPSEFQWGLAGQSDDNKLIQQNVVNQMNDYIASYTSEGKKPTYQDIRSQAQQLMLQITADPTNTGIAWSPKAGEEKVSGFAGDIRNTLSPQQLAVAKADYDTIPPGTLAGIQAQIKQAGLDPSNKDLVEQLAGALATNNKARAKQLLGLTPGK